MSDVAVRKDSESRQAQARPRTTEGRGDPFRMMAELMGLDAVQDYASYRASAGFTPCFEVKETRDGYIFKADVPGVKEGDLDITVTGNRLAVSGKREAERPELTDTYYTYERSYGSFNRSFTLPEGVDMGSVHADLKDGVLTLTVHKTPETKPKKIAIQSPARKS